MKILVNSASIKLIDLGATKLLFNKLPQLNFKDKKGNEKPLDLQGLGHTANDPGAGPWLITATSTRASYIFYEYEQSSTSYVYEKLHLYDHDLAKEAARAISTMIAKR